MNVVLLGSTGATGSSILKHLDQLTTIEKITTISRSSPKTQSDKINSIVDSVENWYKPENYTSNDTAISAFGTTKANAGGIEKFEEIDRGYNYKFAQAAKENGVKNFILISSHLLDFTPIKTSLIICFCFVYRVLLQKYEKYPKAPKK